MNAEQAMVKIAEVLDVSPDEIHQDTVAADISVWDSMGTMSLVLWLSSDFDIELGPSDTNSLQSVKQVLALLEKHGKLSPVSN